MFKPLVRVVLIGLIFAIARPVLAVPIVSVDVDVTTAGIQSSTTVDLADSFQVDIVIAGVDFLSPLNAFELDLGFDPILAATGAVSGGFLLAPSIVVQLDLLAPEVEFAEATLLPAGAIGGGILVSVFFDATGVGTSVLNLNDVILSAPFAVPIATAGINNATVTVQGAAVVTEPGTLLLLGIVLLALAGRRLQLR